MKIRFLLFILISIAMLMFNACKNNVTGTNPSSSPKHYTLVSQPDSTAGKDALISSYSSGSNYSKDKSMHAYCWTLGGVLVIDRALIQFDLSKIPAESRIDSAYLSFYFSTEKDFTYANTHVGDNSMLLQRIAQNWNDKTVTWITQPQVDTRHTVWIDSFSNPQQDYKNIDVTLIIRDIISSNNN